MYISEMIKRLEALHEKYGDIPVCVFDPDLYDLIEVQSLEPETDDSPMRIHLI